MKPARKRSCRRPAAFFAALAAATLLAGPAGARASTDAEDRGNLSLAWDAHESGLCDEVLRYVDEITPGSASAPEGLWLKADCLRSLNRYGEALALLESGPGRSAKDWEATLRAVVEDWVWSAGDGGDYGTALRAVDRGLAILPGDPALESVQAATAFRREVKAVAGGQVRDGALGRLPWGEEVLVNRGKAPPPGRGWVRVYPWEVASPWVPELTLEDWLPSVAERLGRDGRSLWMRVPRTSVERFLTTAARRHGLSVRRVKDGVLLAKGGEEVFWDREEWIARAAVEGLGARGSALDAVASVLSTLKSRVALLGWLDKNHGSLLLARDGPVVRLRHPATGRTYDLDLDSWATSYDLESKEWKDFWSDVAAELGRTPGAYRCFCGRELLLRESLTRDPGNALVVEKAKGYSVVLTALCPLHQQVLTSDLLRQWGVTPAQAHERARKDAGEKPWDLSFERGEEGGARYLAFRGEGASSLVRWPELLLGALEAVEGSEVRGTSVQVFAPTASSIVVLGGEVAPGKAQAAATRSLLRGARKGEAAERLGYRTTLTLPPKSQGVFEVRSAEEP